MVTSQRDGFAHSGGLDAFGGHNDRKNGGYHYHGSSRSSSYSYTPPSTTARTTARTASRRTTSSLSTARRDARSSARTPDERASEAFDAIGEAMATLHYLADHHPETPVGKEAKQVIFRVNACNDEWEAMQHERDHEEQELKAENKLRLAKSMLKQKPSIGEKWLTDIVEQFPNTSAAKEAQELLDQL